MRKSVLILVCLVAVTCVAPWGVNADSPCETIDRAIGFTSEDALDSFLQAATQAAKDPSKGDRCRQLLTTMMSSNKAFELKGGVKVEVLSTQQGSDPSLEKMQVQEVKSRKTYWVPAGALDCG